MKITWCHPQCRLAQVLSLKPHAHIERLRHPGPRNRAIIEVSGNVLSGVFGIHSTWDRYWRARGDAELVVRDTTDMFVSL